MKRKEYQKPAMQQVTIRQGTCLLTGTTPTVTPQGGGAGVNDYKRKNEEEW
jgi:hypothetical protein